MVVVPRPALSLLLVVVALGGGGCDALGDAARDARTTTAATPADAVRLPAIRTGPGQAPGALSAARDVRGIHPGLTAPQPTERSRVDALIDGVRVGPRLGRGGYDRERFGPAWTDGAPITWGGNDCRTREDVLRRDLRTPTLRPGTPDADGRDCVVLDGLLADPYTGRLIEFSKSRPTEVQIDHVIPLFYAWQLGARDWSAVKREQFANDPLNLLAVDGATNQRKGAAGPNAWLPPNRALRCAYAVRIARVARRYALAVTRFDREQMQRQCASRT